MSLESTLVGLVDAATTTTVESRIYPRRAPDPDPQATNLPLIVYLLIGRVPDLDLHDPGMKRVRLRLTPWAKTSSEITAITAQLHAALDYANGTGIDRILPDNDIDRYDEDRLLYGQDVEFLVFAP